MNYFYDPLLQRPICIFNAFRANLWGYFRFDISRTRRAGSGAAELQIENTNPFFLRTLKLRLVSIHIHIHRADVYVHSVTEAPRGRRAEGGGKGVILDVGSGAPRNFECGPRRR